MRRLRAAAAIVVVAAASLGLCLRRTAARTSTRVTSCSRPRPHRSRSSTTSPPSRRARSSSSIPIRSGSVATDESVIDLMTGAPLKFQEVSGAEARESGLTNASLDGRYIRVELARPVPQGGEGRIRIIKTYKDPKSYFRDGNAIVFDRPLGIKRNAVVLPPGYELVSCNIPSQVIEEADGRVGISFMNTYPSQAPLVMRASPLEQTPGAGRAPVSGCTREHAGRSAVRRCRRWSACACRNVPSRIARSSTSSRARRLTRSACTTTTQRPERVPTSTSTSFAAAVPCPIRPRRSSTPARRSRSRR